MARGDIPTPEQIKAKRLRYGFTQTEAGALIYYTLNGWQKIEAGQRELGAALWEYWQLRARQEYQKRQRQQARKHP